MENINEITATLTQDEKIVLKDTLLHGEWGSCDFEFLNDEGGEVPDPAIGFCTNDAKLGGHYQGRIMSFLFRSIYRKLCTPPRNNTGQYLSHARDWWGDGSGDMLFIRESMYDLWLEWAKN